MSFFKPDNLVAKFRFYIIDDEALVFGTNDLELVDGAKKQELIVIDTTNNLSIFSSSVEWESVTPYEDRASYYEMYFSEE